MRLFLDANILFSAAYREGSPAALLFELAQAGFCELQTSPFALEEARRNVIAKAAGRTATLDRLVPQLILASEPSRAMVDSAGKHGLPPKDAPILAAALVGKADALVTGDRTHFGHLFGRSVEGTKVVTLADALALIAGVP